MGAKTKVAILGGGVAALTAAYALSEVNRKYGDRYDITLYQLGWRLGGKTASGRNRAVGERIEEHGLHIWTGFYENAFTVLRSALLALGRDPGTPQATIDQTFWRQDQVFLTEKFSANPGEPPTWLPWPFWFEPYADPSVYPGRDDIFAPADSVMPPLSEFIRRGVAAFAYAWEYYSKDWPGDPAMDAKLRLAELPPEVQARLAALAPLEKPSGHPLLDLAAALAIQAQDGRSRAHDQAQADLLIVVQLLAAHVSEAYASAGGSTELRRYWVGLAFLLRVIGGMLINDCLRYGLHVLDQFDFMEFLGQLAPVGESAALAQCLYDYAFAYYEGEQPILSACSAVQGALRMFLTYKGAFFYKATAGMGDTICTPIYEVLRRRGVTFNFFHQVTSLEPTADGFDIGSIAINRQVDLALGAPEYEPLRIVNDLPCWPSEPRWEQLLDGEKLQAEGVNFEDVIDPLPPPAAQLVLQKGQDFDKVILGISVGALKDLCAPLVAANIGWADMVENLATTRTQAFQLWVDQEVTNLGGPFVQPQPPPFGYWPILPPIVPAPPGEGPPPTFVGSIGPILTGFVKPFDTYSDMSQLLSAEAWPVGATGPLSIAYFCSVMKDDDAPNNQKAANAAVKANALDWMQTWLPTIWTGVVAPEGQLQWNLLHTEDPGLQGPARFDQQFWQANINPSERYVLSLPGTLQHRMDPGDSGYRNLYLAGDWTRTPDINAGCVECAAMSGLLAASACAAIDIPIVSSGTLYASPRFAQYGGWTQLPPPPSTVSDASVYAWMLPADAQALQGLLDRSLNFAAGRRRFRPLLDVVCLSIVSSNGLAAGSPPFSAEGTMPETDIGFWIPVGCWDEGQLLPTLGWFPACLLVDNPYPTASGREIWGFPKFVAQTTVPTEPKSAGPFEAQAYVISQFGPQATPSWRNVLNIQGAGVAFTGFDGDGFSLLKRLAASANPVLMAALEAAHAASPLLPGLNLPAPVVFLKQFHDAANSTDACYQEILKGALTVTSITGAGVLSGDWTIELAYTDSLPFVRDLGLGSPQSGVLTLKSQLAFWGAADFTVAFAKPF